LGDLAGENGGNGGVGPPIIGQFRGRHENQHEAGLGVDEAGLAVAGDEVHGSNLSGFALMPKRFKINLLIIETYLRVGIRREKIFTGRSHHSPGRIK